MNGVLNINKPTGKTSHDIVADIRKLLPKKTKVGHTGTLDPFATGILLIAIGNATRLIEYSHSWSKVYKATITLGATSDTDDVTGKITPIDHKNSPPDKGELGGVLTSFQGSQKQIPPTYAAIKVAGKKLYEYAREGIEEGIERHPRDITIHNIKLIDYTYPNITIEVEVSTGTYIRALARDIGEKLKTGAFVKTLERVKLGPLELSTSVKHSSFSTYEDVKNNLQKTETLIHHLPSLILTPQDVAKHIKGVAVPTLLPKELHDGWQNTPIATYDENNNIATISHYNPTTRLLQPNKVIQ